VKKGFVQNGNYARFLQAVNATEQRGSMESGLILVSGEPGLGKSKAVDRWAADNHALYFRAVENMGHDFFLRSLCAVAGINLLPHQDEHGNKVRAPRNKNETQKRLTEHVIRKQCPIVIDEAQKLMGHDARLLEVMRDISDSAEIIVVLVAGVANFGSQIKAYPQISRRIFMEVPFEHWKLQDVKLVCKQLLEITAEDALLERITIESKGLMRLVMNGLSTLERIAKANGVQHACMADFEGQELITDWDGEEPRKRRSK